MNLIDEIRTAWGWIGLEPVGIVAENDFGNLIITDADSAYWRLCPEEASCKRIAANRTDFEKLRGDAEFQIDWHMDSLVDVARETCGPLADGQKYALKIPACLGGTYTADNIAIVPFKELISFCGDIAEQMKDVPDGSKVRLEVVNYDRERVNEAG